MNKAVFLDRDGVLNQAVINNGCPYPPKSKDEVVIPADVGTALKQLKHAGYYLFVVTNQPDVARGDVKRETVEEINNYLAAQLPLDKFYVCYHDNQDHCQCRKPLPGLLLMAAKEYAVDLSKSFMIGDRWKDIAAGKQAGCTTIFLDLNYAEKYACDTKPDFTTDTLLQAADWILAN